MIVEFSARQLFYILGRSSVGLFGVSSEDQEHWQPAWDKCNRCWDMISQELVKLVNGAIDQSSKRLLLSFILKLDIVSVNFITFVCCKLCFCQDFALTLSSVSMFLSSLLSSSWTKNCLIAIFKLCHFSGYQLIYEDFGENTWLCDSRLHN